MGRVTAGRFVRADAVRIGDRLVIGEDRRLVLRVIVREESVTFEHGPNRYSVTAPSARLRVERTSAVVDHDQEARRPRLVYRSESA